MHPHDGKTHGNEATPRPRLYIIPYVVWLEMPKQTQLGAFNVQSCANVL